MTRALGSSTVAVCGLGFGAASIGNLYQAVDDDRAAATVDAAWRGGIRYFDTAPHYGLGMSERRLGRALAGRPRDEYVVSTKVGRLLVKNPSPGGTDRANGFDVPATHVRRWDFSADGVRRSLESSLRRLDLGRVDVVLLHDPERSPEPDQALAQGYPALAQLKADGMIGAIGLGSMDVATLVRFATESDVDTLMIAGRYTLLEQPALDDLLPICARRGIGVLNAGVFNSGLLATPWPDATRPYDYGSVPAGILARAQAIAAVCLEHGVALPQAALAFAGAHPAVASVVVGADRPSQVEQSARWQAMSTPAELWRDLVDRGLLRADAPVPG